MKIIKRAYQDVTTKVKYKFVFALVASIGWAFGSYLLAEQWISELAQIVGLALSYIIIFGIAIIPGFMNGFVAVSLALDERPKHRHFHADQYPDVTILVAAYNESAAILNTVRSIGNQKYPGKMTCIVINDGSKDDTVAKVEEILPQYPWLQLLDIKKNAGKSNALNEGLKLVKTPIVITVDGDTYLYKNSLKHLVSRYMSDPEDTVAVAGSILLRNAEATFCTKMQMFDYYIGIASVKRLQSMYHGTLVAQGAFSLYETDIVRELGGWPHTVGEDIVLTWGILRKGYRVGYAEDAIVFTNAPENWKQFINQRIRWSRGLVEAFKEHWPLLFKPRLTTLFIWWNLLFPYLDLVYTFAFVPGVILACFGVFWIAGPMTLVLVPLALLMNIMITSKQTSITKKQRLYFKKHPSYFIYYALFYSLILQPACVFGYIKEMVAGHVKNWGTK